MDSLNFLPVLGGVDSRLFLSIFGFRPRFFPSLGVDVDALSESEALDGLLEQLLLVLQLEFSDFKLSILTRSDTICC